MLELRVCARRRTTACLVMFSNGREGEYVVMFEDSSQISRSAEAMLDSLLENKAKDAFGVPEVLDAIMDGMRKMDGLLVKLEGDIPQDVSIRSLVTDSGTQLFELMPSGSSDSDLTVVFYHGGGFIMEIAEPHWNFCFELVRTLRCHIIVAIYPLAPVHTYEDAYIACYDAFSYASSLSDDSKLILIGDSAGAHLAIAMAQMALNKGVRQPDLVIAISPWIDIADEVEGKDGIDPIDPILAMSGLRKVAGIWAPSSRDAKTFPPCILHGPLEGLAPMMIFSGTREVFHPEAKVFAEKAERAGVDVDLIIGEGLWHCWASMIEMDEGQRAMERMVVRIEKL